MLKMLQLLAALIISGFVHGVPMAQQSSRLRVQNFGPQVEKEYTTSPILSTELTGLDVSLLTKSYLQTISVMDYVVTNQYTSKSTGITHVYVRQRVHGLDVINAVGNINIKDGRIISVGDSFWKGEISMESMVWHPGKNQFRTKRLLTQILDLTENSDIETEERYFSPQEAFQALAQYLKQQIPEDRDLSLKTEHSLTGDAQLKLTKTSWTESDIPIKPAYINMGNGLRKVWSMQIEMKDNWFDAQVDAKTGRVLMLIDWVNELQDSSEGDKDQYRVYPFGTNDPNDGERQLLVGPADSKASPLGWHDVGGGKNYSDTKGNNVKASDGGWNKENKRARGRRGEDGGLYFDFDLDLHKEPRQYIEASVTNLFYWNNRIHDIFYHYGFNEEAGNFQQNNFGHGGEGGDSVFASAQDGSGYNNANFATPPDGGHGKMRMYVWNIVNPYRDGDLEGGIIMHEYAHGISIRLTGGPANSGCLGWGESGGMGEGWGDTFATVFRMRPEHNRTKVFAMGEYANGGKGIRKFPYSTDIKVNPSTYKILDKPAYWGVHAIGEVWAEMLYEVYWNLVDKLGFTSDWVSADPNKGNTLFIQLLIDGMKLQPCHPLFVDARDAILQAEHAITGGRFHCDIWNAFAKRGLGVGAVLKGGSPWGGGIRTESFEVPATCSQ